MPRAYFQRVNDFGSPGRLRTSACRRLTRVSRLARVAGPEDGVRRLARASPRGRRGRRACQNWQSGEPPRGRLAGSGAQGTAASQGARLRRGRAASFEAGGRAWCVAEPAPRRLSDASRRRTRGRKRLVRLPFATMVERRPRTLANGSRGVPGGGARRAHPPTRESPPRARSAATRSRVGRTRATALPSSLSYPQPGMRVAIDALNPSGRSAPCPTSRPGSSPRQR